MFERTILCSKQNTLQLYRLLSNQIAVRGGNFFFRPPIDRLSTPQNQLYFLFYCLKPRVITGRQLSNQLVHRTFASCMVSYWSLPRYLPTYFTLIVIERKNQRHCCASRTLRKLALGYRSPGLTDSNSPKRAAHGTDACDQSEAILVNDVTRA